MLKVEHLESYGWEAAIRGMRNPLNSWDKSDTFFIEPDRTYYTITGASGLYYGNPSFVSQGFELGQNDLGLMCRLIHAGPDHAKFLRQIGISMDILAPLYWWKEMDTYKVGTVANSCSTMHKIAEKEFTIDDFSHEHMDGDSLTILQRVIETLNSNRLWYLQDGDKKWWWQMIQLLPSSYNQKRTMTLNYAAARNMVHARCNHKLDEWHVLCEALERLPYAWELIVQGGQNGISQGM